MDAIRMLLNGLRAYKPASRLGASRELVDWYALTGIVASVKGKEKLARHLAGRMSALAEEVGGTSLPAMRRSGLTAPGDPRRPPPRCARPGGSPKRRLEGSAPAPRPTLRRLIRGARSG
jgi:hypothetical protein